MALDLALEVLVANPDLEQHAAKAIADQLRSAFARGIGMDLLERIASREWSHDARSLLTSAMRAALFYEKSLPEALRAATESLAADLAGSSLPDRLEVMLRTDYWHLAVGVEERLSGPKAINVLLLIG